jgi:predicted amidohydrolase
MADPIRVAAVQFASGTSVKSNLATCLRMIDQAAETKAQLLVLPEFCNHISWYDNDEHAWEVAVALGGEFLSAIAAKAKATNSYIDINVSLRSSVADNARAITVSSLLFGPAGELVAQADKQTLMGHENDYFVRAEQSSKVIETPLGRLGIFPCRDGVTFETPRCLALRGAQLYCDSLNSFAIDEASLHVPARAPENKVFLVSANKIGPLIPVEQLAAVSAATHIPVQFLLGAGESQIVSPLGEVLAKAPKDQEAVIFADIDLTEADDKCRPDGTDIFAARRPALYSDIVKPPEGEYCIGGSEQLAVAMAGPTSLVELGAVIAELKNSIELLVLPELCLISADPKLDIEVAAEQSQDLIDYIRQQCQRSDLLVCTTVVEFHLGVACHVGVLINKHGVFAKQQQLHKVNRLDWSDVAPDCSDSIVVTDLPWGKAAILVGDDGVFPEVAKAAALKGAHVLLAPCALQEQWETKLGLLSRAAENRVCLVANDANGNGMITGLEADFTIMTPWQNRVFDGKINYPLVTPQLAAGITKAVINPIAASDKLMSANTDLLVGRPWHLSGDIIDEQFVK